ncbi:MAG: hypothetical protein PUQ00_07150 [Nostoc sp. S13]|nr:hypothetical protein [Nostoc sp. S13]
MKKNSEVRIQESESISRGFRPATFLLTTKQENLVGVLNPIIHPPVVQNSFCILTPDS